MNGNDSKLRAALARLALNLDASNPAMIDLVMCRGLVDGMRHLLDEKERMIADAVKSSGEGLGVDLPGMARHMVSISPTWSSNDIAEIAMQVMLEKWGHWFSSHWHAAGFVAALMPHFYAAGGKVDEFAAKWSGLDIPFNVWGTERDG